MEATTKIEKSLNANAHAIETMADCLTLAANAQAATRQAMDDLYEDLADMEIEKDDAMSRAVNAEEMVEAAAFAEDDSYWRLGRVGSEGCIVRAYDHERRDNVGDAYFIGRRVPATAAPQALRDRCPSEDYIYVLCKIDRTFTTGGGRRGEIVAVPRPERMGGAWEYDYRVAVRG